MPNGGPDNCGTCGFNARNKGEWRNPKPDETISAFCTIRKVAVPHDHWTYCANWHSKRPEPEGPIYASGLYERGYRRIPWHGPVAPETAEAGRCCVCGSEFGGLERGLEVAQVERPALQFCCNAHYLQWWREQHPGQAAAMSDAVWEH